MGDWLNPFRMFDPRRPAGRLMFAWGHLYALAIILFLTFFANVMLLALLVMGIREGELLLTESWSDVSSGFAGFLFLAAMVILALRRLRGRGSSLWNVFALIVPFYSIFLWLYLLLASERPDRRPWPFQDEIDGKERSPALPTESPARPVTGRWRSPIDRQGGFATGGDQSSSPESEDVLQQFRLAMAPVELDFLAAYLARALKKGMSEQEAEALYEQAKQDSPYRRVVPSFQEVLPHARAALGRWAERQNGERNASQQNARTAEPGASLGDDNRCTPAAERDGESLETVFTELSRSDMEPIRLLPYMVAQILGDRIERQWSRKPYVRMFNYLLRRPVLYESGAVLGRARADKLHLLEPLLGRPPYAGALVDHARTEATERLQQYGREPLTFLRFINDAELDRLSLLRQDGRIDRRRLVKVGQQKLPYARLVGPELVMLVAEGIGFGSLYPDMTERMIHRACKSGTADEWRKWYDAGLAIPETRFFVSLAESERAALALVASYVAQYSPQLMGPLELGDVLLEGLEIGLLQRSLDAMMGGGEFPGLATYGAWGLRQGLSEIELQRMYEQAQLSAPRTIKPPSFENVLAAARDILASCQTSDTEQQSPKFETAQLPRTAKELERLFRLREWERKRTGRSGTS